jgi:hypothetical protein
MRDHLLVPSITLTYHSGYEPRELIALRALDDPIQDEDILEEGPFFVQDLVDLPWSSPDQAIARKVK